MTDPSLYTRPAPREPSKQVNVNSLPSSRGKRRGPVVDEEIKMNPKQVTPLGAREFCTNLGLSEPSGWGCRGMGG